MTDKPKHPYDTDVFVCIDSKEARNTSWSPSEVDKYLAALVESNPNLKLDELRNHVAHGRTIVIDEDHIAAAQVKRYVQGSFAAFTIPHHGQRTSTDRSRKRPHPPTDGAVEHRIRIDKPPAYALTSIASRLLSAGAYKRYVEPHIADIYHEYFQAIANRDEHEAKKIVLWGYVRALWPLIAAIGRTIKSLLSVSGA